MLGKWRKYKVLREAQEIAEHLPKTKKMNESALWDLLNKYGQVILKPSIGSGGKGIIRVSKRENEKYKIHIGNNQKKMEGKKPTYSYISKRIKPHKYIVQYRVPLAEVQNSPFDLRVMVQRKKGSTWNVTGKIARVAGKGYVITNVCRGKSKVISVETALRRSSLRGLPSKQISSSIDDVGLKAAKKLEQHYPDLRTIGFDMGLDNSGKVWIIEANFEPDLTLFTYLRDRRATYRKMLAYQKG